MDLACRDKQGTDAGYQRHRKIKQKACRECQDANLARLADWKSKNPERFYRAHKNATLKRVFGISLDDYEYMLKNQNGVCAICKKVSIDGRKLSVDHDHSTGRVRGLLCTKCNTVLGKMADDPALLRRAAEYLEKS